MCRASSMSDDLRIVVADIGLSDTTLHVWQLTFAKPRTRDQRTVFDPRVQPRLAGCGNLRRVSPCRAKTREPHRTHRALDRRAKVLGTVVIVIDDPRIFLAQGGDEHAPLTVDFLGPVKFTLEGVNEPNLSSKVFCK